MIHNSTKLKDLIKNLSKKKFVNIQILMRIYMIERLWERIKKFEYRDRFIIKGDIKRLSGECKIKCVSIKLIHFIFLCYHYKKGR